MSILKRAYSEADITYMFLKRLEKECKKFKLVFRLEYPLYSGSRIDIVAVDPNYPNIILFGVEVKTQKHNKEATAIQVQRYREYLNPIFVCIGVAGIRATIKKIKPFLEKREWMSEEEKIQSLEYKHPKYPHINFNLDPKIVLDVVQLFKDRKYSLKQAIKQFKYVEFVSQYSEVFGLDYFQFSAIIKTHKLLTAGYYLSKDGVWVNQEKCKNLQHLKGEVRVKKYNW